MRRLAIVLGVLALVAALFGCMPGKHITVGDRCWVQSSINVFAILALVAIAAGAGYVALVPERRVAMTWLSASAILALGYVIARLWLLHPGEIAVALWPRIVTLSLIAVIATTMFGMFIWLIMSDGISEPGSRQS